MYIDFNLKSCGNLLLSNRKLIWNLWSSGLWNPLKVGLQSGLPIAGLCQHDPLNSRNTDQASELASGPSHTWKQKTKGTMRNKGWLEMGKKPVPQGKRRQKSVSSDGWRCVSKLEQERESQTIGKMGNKGYVKWQYKGACSGLDEFLWTVIFYPWNFFLNITLYICVYE